MENNVNSLSCFLIGDCYFEEYKYTFVYENKEYESDKCFELRYGSNVCYYDDKKFYNVSYTSKLIRENHVHQEGFLHVFWPSLVFTIILFIVQIFLYFKK